MTAALRFGFVLPLSLLAGCMKDGDFAVRLASLGDAADADAVAARRCADELRAVMDRVPAAAAGALEMSSGEISPLGMPPFSTSVRLAPTLAARANEEVARRERAIEGDRRAIRSAQGVGPAAWGRALDAQRLARGTRERLCQARDVATTVASMLEHRAVADRTVTLVR